MSLHAARKKFTTYLASQQCSIYLYDAHAETGIGPLPSSKVPKSWSDDHRYATEVWLSRNLRSHPWRASSIASADVVFVAATFARSCHAQKNFYGRKLWQAILRDARLWPVDGGKGIGVMSKQRERFLRADTSNWGPPKAFSMQYPACPPWVDNMGTAYVPRDAFMLTEHVPKAKGFASRGIVSPFVVSRPDWLAGASSDAHPPDDLTPWARRKLVFFVGHLPKVTIARTRFDVWRQLRNDPRVTTKSHTGLCLIGSYSNCKRHSDATLRDMAARGNNSFFVSRCWEWCGGERARLAGISCGASTLRTPHDNYLSMKRECKHYENVDLSDGLISDLRRDASLDWSEREYLRRAMAHKFCLVVQGDFPGTPKIAEMLAIGAAGGCLPVFALRVPIARRGHHGVGARSGAAGGRWAGGGVETSLTEAVRASLPFARWLDYCRVSLLVSEHAVRHNASAVLEALNALPRARIESMRTELRRVRTAFGFWANSTPDAPSATDFIFAELCVFAKAFRGGDVMASPSVAGAESASTPFAHRSGAEGLSRCLLA